MFLLPLVEFRSKTAVCNAMHGKHNCPVISYPVGLAIHLDCLLSGSLVEAAELENTALLP